ncbi:pyridoxal 5'-phosphate synthase glutaminase subunit PdxT [Microlunatus sp. Y2014]|uniref:pyridoxal 5'-phosphate synthase glutaminase subunit PdxT n=1 Tax=Microlunatus sp. Y2014 TaxID=3418488 RepID=UPI003DA77FA3
MARRPRIGVLALQGGVTEHLDLLTGLGADAVRVRTPADLAGLDGIVLPGGESSTIDRLLRMFELAAPLRTLIGGGLPTLATCAGLIILADFLEDPAPGQQTLGLLDITVRRNAFGAQVVSEEATLDTPDGPVRAAFIRAPIVTRVGPGVEVLARHHGQVVGVRTGTVTAVAFHPELTADTTLHQWLLDPRAAGRRQDRAVARRVTDP